MWPIGRRRRGDPYLKQGRLADVLAAIQVMGAGERPERAIKDWAYEFDQSRDESTIARWNRVFEEHPEFFKIYRLSESPDLKAALRVRYILRNFDSKTGVEYTLAEKEKLPEDERNKLTSRPLIVEQIQTLLSTAIALHTRAVEELQARRYWIPLLAAVLGFIGAILGNLLSALLRLGANAKVP